jgi:superfamily II DNA/RNA helicase
MSLLGYFNSLRELGGSRRIVEDEINYRVQKFADRRRVGEAQGSFADRKIARDVLELTSRVGTDEVAHAKRRLALPFSHKEHVDIALATNMISVGLDITRLGLMVVFGQPKTTAEYIQTTSRVGRDRSRPGLVVTMLNIHKPRDRSHYERFTAYHESFYRSVEVSSVTPFSPRALDRGLAGTAVALARHGDAAMTPPLGASEIQSRRGALEWVVGAISARASAADRDASPEDAEALRKRVQERANDLLDEWVNIASDYAKDGVALQYQEEVGAAQRLLRDFLDPELDRLPPRHRKFRANRSMRDVEPSVNLWLRSLADTEVAGADS